MSTLEARGTSLRGYRRRKAVLDLNVPPRELEGTSQQAGSEELISQPLQPVPPAPAAPPAPPAPPAAIDVEAIDDDVIESSAIAFTEAKNNSRRVRRRAVVDVDSGLSAGSTNINQNRSRRSPPIAPVINCEQYINLESSPMSKVGEIIPPPPPPKEPTFNCPICMGTLNEEMSTRCGHIFCKACIKAAIAVQGKCPTCRKRVTGKELIRVFLPSAS